MNHLEQKRYDNIEGLRAIAMFGIVAMHVKSNLDVHIPGYLYSVIITFFTNFVFLFMMISAFSMCCGYYDKIREGRISIDQFYKRRYDKIWPFFSLLVILEVAVDPSLKNIYEGFADLTLCFGLLPDPRITVVGVGWTLGVIFVFYLLFPFFCFLLRDTKHALVALVISIALNYVCIHYFFNANHVLEGYSSRSNILFCAMYFIAGGICFLFKKNLEQLSRLKRWILYIVTIGTTIIYFSIPLLPQKLRDKEDVFYLIVLIMFSLWLCSAITKSNILLNNKCLSFFGRISMEIYLCHMAVFRVILKCKLLENIQNPIIAYLMALSLVIAGSVVCSVAAKAVLNKVSTIIEER